MGAWLIIFRRRSVKLLQETKRGTQPPCAADLTLLSRSCCLSLLLLLKGVAGAEDLTGVLSQRHALALPSATSSSSSSSSSSCVSLKSSRSLFLLSVGGGSSSCFFSSALGVWLQNLGCTGVVPRDGVNSAVNIKNVNSFSFLKRSRFNYKRRKKIFSIKCTYHHQRSWNHLHSQNQATPVNRKTSYPLHYLKELYSK